jgi:hypothetical protein
MGQTRFTWPDDETQPVRRPAGLRPVAAEASLTLLAARTEEPPEEAGPPLPSGLADELGRILGEALAAQFRADAVRKSVSRPRLTYTNPDGAVSKVDDE